MTTQKLSDLTTFTSGTLGTTSSSDAQDTHFIYDPTSGNLTNEQYGYTASGSYAYQFQYSYNSNNQLQTIGRPGSNTTLFYNSAGQQNGALTVDPFTDASIADSSTPVDDQGRPTSVTETLTDTSGNQTSAVSNAFTYDPASGQLASESQLAGTSTNYAYYGPQDNGSGQAPGALKDLTLTQYGQIIGNTPVYTYDIAGRPQTITYSLR